MRLSGFPADALVTVQALRISEEEAEAVRLMATVTTDKEGRAAVRCVCVDGRTCLDGRDVCCVAMCLSLTPLLSIYIMRACITVQVALLPAGLPGGELRDQGTNTTFVLSTGFVSVDCFFVRWSCRQHKGRPCMESRGQYKHMHTSNERPSNANRHLSNYQILQANVLQTGAFGLSPLYSLSSAGPRRRLVGPRMWV